MSVEEFFKQRAVNVVAFGQYTPANWFDPQGRPRTFACRTSRVSPYRMIVSVPVVGRVGDRLTSYFGDFGRLDGEVSATMSGALLLELELTYAMREKLANKLTWLEQKQKDPAIIDQRKDPRIVPANPHSSVTFADGAVHECFVIDMSSTGVAVSAEVQPKIGTPLAVGACVGRVVRHFPEGFAVRFVESHNRDNLERRIARPAPRSFEKPEAEPAD
ncbi:MAG: PilZ domain-containing protein [Xanthobacteraceae bacterium]